MSFFFFNDTATTEIYTLSLHDALPISTRAPSGDGPCGPLVAVWGSERGRIDNELPSGGGRSEEHTSELQSQSNIVCRLLLEKKKRPARSSATALRGTRMPIGWSRRSTT